MSVCPSLSAVFRAMPDAVFAVREAAVEAVLAIDAQPLEIGILITGLKRLEGGRFGAFDPVCAAAVFFAVPYRRVLRSMQAAVSCVHASETDAD
jgi:hypothetical protein